MMTLIACPIEGVPPVLPASLLSVGLGGRQQTGVDRVRTSGQRVRVELSTYARGGRLGLWGGERETGSPSPRPLDCFGLRGAAVLQDRARA